MFLVYDIILWVHNNDNTNTNTNNQNNDYRMI